MKRFGFCAGFILLTASLTAQAPSGWKTLKSPSIPPAKRTPGGKCQIAVPDDWFPDNTYDRAQAHSPDGRGLASVAEYPVSPVAFSTRKSSTLTDYKNRKAALLRTYHKDVLDIKVLENSAARLSVLETNTEPLSSGIMTWTLLTAGNPVCYAQISVNGTSPTAPATDRAASQKLLPIAQKIVASFGPAK